MEASWALPTLFLATCISVAVARAAWRSEKAVSRGLTVTAVGVVGNLTTDFAAILLDGSYVLSLLSGTCAILIVVGWVYLVAHYTGNEWAVEGYRLAVLAAPMLAVIAVEWAELLHSLAGGAGHLLVADLDPLVDVYVFYSYLLTAVTVVALAVRFRNERPIYRRRAAILAFAPFPPALLAAAALVGPLPETLDLTPIGYALTTGIALYGLRKYDLLEVVPLARETTVNNIDDAVIAVTDDGVVASVNDPATELLAVTDDVVGRDLAEGLADWPAVVDAVETGEEPQIRVGDAHVNVSLTPIERGSVRLGTVVQLKDVTREVERREALQEKQRRLEYKNRQLDEFASVVSHDIRNPLSLAQGHLDLIAEEVESEGSVDAIADAHQRIEEIVDDLLHLARQGQRVTEPTTVDFAAVADEARDTVGLAAGAFAFAGPETVTADRSRLKQLLENLLRNSVDHAGADVTVRVGPLEDERGFYVEDDGPGVPVGERERVFDHGYTTSDDGTGLGLNIVASIADAHGWDIRVDESADGGARFEFVTGADVAQSVSPAADR